MMNHTPGPWSVDGFTEVEPWLYLVVIDSESEDGDQIALVLTGDNAGEANARLIAAAPRLLGACRWILQADEDGELEHGPSGLRALRSARAAIAKAESQPRAPGT